jgi:hypothetical protein
MHCPGCGQQQISSETKFCSRCGLPLSLVSEVVAHGGTLPQLAEIGKNSTIFTRRNGLAFSLLWLLFFLLIMAPLWGILRVEQLAGASAVIGIFGGLMWSIASLVFLKKPFVSYTHPPLTAPPSLYGQPHHSALPPSQSIPAHVYGAPQTGSWRDTNDLQPGSVTEGTTRLLEKDEI